MNEEQNQAAAKPSELSALLGHLRSGKQADADGVTVMVSREACEEAADRLERLVRKAEVLYYEREQARARMESAVRLLTGIHSLLYPAPFTTSDGRTMVFRPKTLDPHEVLQELSDRIRALPDELQKSVTPNAPAQPQTGHEVKETTVNIFHFMVRDQRHEKS